MKLRSIRQLKALKGKKVLLRVAYDVPLKRVGANWAVADDRRIRETLPTIEFLLKHGAAIGLLSKLGRPNGKRSEKYQMDPVAGALSRLLKRKVRKLDDCAGPKVSRAVQMLKPKELVLFENVRFRPEETGTNARFAKELTKEFDLLVFDAFAEAHRNVPSITGVLRYLPSYAGLLVEREVEALSRLLNNPKRPFVVIIGGAKISDKVPVIERLAPLADAVLVGGGVANVFAKAQGIPIADSLVEESGGPAGAKDVVRSAQRILKKWKDKLKLPTDFLAAAAPQAKTSTSIVNVAHGDVIPGGWQFLDVGPDTQSEFLRVIAGAGTIFWNGPLGLFEIPEYAVGTKKIAAAVAKSTGYTVLGGGDTEVVVGQYALEGKFNHVSTGGGASLEFLAKGTLPGLKPLTVNK